MMLPTNTRQDYKQRLTFKALHQQDHPLIVPNPWDIGTAKFLAAMGFQALATTSAGYAFAQGKPDNHIGRDEMLAHAAALVKAVDIPVTADLENGYGEQPSRVAETISKALEIGLAGASIEDTSGKPDAKIYPLALAVERIQAAVEAANSAHTEFVLTARAENFLCGNPDLKDTIRRLQAYQEAGADVLYAPGLSTEADIRAVVSSVDKPVNVVVGLANTCFSVDDLMAMKVKRISLGSAFARLAFGALQQASKEILEKRSFQFSDRTMAFSEINSIMAE